MSSNVLNVDQIEQFIDRGFVKVEQAFPREVALRAQDFLWEKLGDRGVIKSSPSTWTHAMVSIQETYSGPVFNACMTHKLEGCIEDLIGEGRWRDKGTEIGWGWWPVNFSVGAGRPWTVPSGGWHWDGIQFKHTVTAPDQGLLLLPHFSSVKTHGGGTVVAAGSHQIVARFLAAQREPIELNTAIGKCSGDHPWLNALTHEANSPLDRNAAFMDVITVDDHGTRLQVVEVTAEPGDVILCHPFLYHAAAQNLLGTPRFMCNRTTPLKAPMELSRVDGNYSPVEESIRRALHTETCA